MTAARTGHTATRLSDGRVLITGDNSSEIYDPATGTWALTGRIPGTVVGALFVASLPKRAVVLTVGIVSDLIRGDTFAWGKIMAGALMAAAHLASFPGLLSPGGLLGESGKGGHNKNATRYQRNQKRSHQVEAGISNAPVISVNRPLPILYHLVFQS